MAEAMAAGRAALVSDAGGVAEFVRPGENALTYRSGDAEAMAGGLRRLLADPALRARLGAEAHRSAREQFHPDRVCRQILDVYAPFAHAEAA
jgi:glycosyltransferase involved in cell wall biosynthesis